MSKDAGGTLIIMQNQNKIMAGKKPKEEAEEKPENNPREEEKEDFSIILGTRKKKKPAPEDKENEEKEQAAQAESEGKKPAPAEEAPPKKPEKVLTLPELLKKKEDIELFLTSLEDAHQQCKFPEYTYTRLKRKNEADLSTMNQKIKEMEAGQLGIPSGPQGLAAAKAGGKAVGGRQMLSEVNAMLEKRLGGLPSLERLKNLGEEIEKMEDAFSKFSELKTQMAAIRTELDGYQSIVNELKSHEKLFSNDMTDIRNMLYTLQSSITQKTDGKAVIPGKLPAQAGARTDDVTKKLESFSKKMDDVCSKLSSRIDQVSVIEEQEVSGYVNELKKSIDEIRSGLSRYVRKEDLDKIVRQAPGAAPARLEEAKAAKVAPRKPEKQTAGIAELVNFKGKEVVVECSLAPLKSIEEKSMRLYWYRISDKTGEGILTSYSSIQDKKARIIGTVKETKTGSIYLLFSKMA